MDKQIQWYPGHMTKALRALKEQMKLVDLVIEVADARLPASSRNPDIAALRGKKPGVLILNKADLADDEVTQRWLRHLSKGGITAIKADARASGFKSKLNATISTVAEAKLCDNAAKGIISRPVRAFVCGIPNSGKSTLINSLAHRTAARTGNKPGVTKGNQWIKISQGVELLDTPGILWPKFANQTQGRNLAFVGTINDEILNRDELAFFLLKFLAEKYPQLLAERYGKPSAEFTLEYIAERRKCLKKGGLFDTEKAAKILIEDFRDGRIGKISLEEP